MSRTADRHRPRSAARTSATPTRERRGARRRRHTAAASSAHPGDVEEHVAVARAAVERAVAGEVPADELAGGRGGGLGPGAAACGADLRVLARQPLPVARDRRWPGPPGWSGRGRGCPTGSGGRPTACPAAAPRRAAAERPPVRPPDRAPPTSPAASTLPPVADAARSGARQHDVNPRRRGAGPTGSACSWIGGAVSTSSSAARSRSAAARIFVPFVPVVTGNSASTSIRAGTLNAASAAWQRSRSSSPVTVASGRSVTNATATPSAPTTFAPSTPSCSRRNDSISAGSTRKPCSRSASPARHR